MPQEFTFGFEWELETGGPEVVNWLALNRPDLLPVAEIHRYHCDCERCDFGNGYPLRAQHDSSCSGELITMPFRDIRVAQDVAHALQQAACDTDAEPGYHAGFHVHVRQRGITSNTHMHDAFFEYLRWEDALGYLAHGRFMYSREQNSVVGPSLIYELRSYTGVGLNYKQMLTQVAASAAAPEIKQRLFAVHFEADRHSQLNIRTRHNTWEFRLWNSTRSAWRMELYCRLSLAMLRADVVAELRRTEPDHDPIVAATQLTNVMRTTRRGQLADLMDRQLIYRAKIALEGVSDSFLAA